jgi:aspartate/glutamate racemase
VKLNPGRAAAFRFDGEDATYNYVGEAAVGTSTAAPVSVIIDTNGMHYEADDNDNLTTVIIITHRPHEYNHYHQHFSSSFTTSKLPVLELS